MNQNINLYSDILLHTESVDFRLMTDRNIKNEIGFSKVLHSHTYYEMFYVSKGKMEVVLQDRVIPVPENSFIVLPPELLHYTFSPDPGLERFSVAFRITAGNDAPEGRRFMQLFHALLPRGMEIPGPVGDAFRRMEQYYLSVNPDRLHLMAACFYEILYLYRTSADSDLTKQAASRNDISSSYREYIIDDYINNHFTQDISLSALADTVYLSESQVNRIIHSNYGQSFRQRIIFLRMENAAQLLCGTRLQVKEIAAAVGYRSAHGFHDIFKKTYGLSPEEYRRKHMPAGRG